MSGSPAGSAEPTPIEDAKSAEEILRQAQLLIQGQIDANKSLDAKAMSVMQASLSLAGASLGAAALAVADRPWLPGWASAGLIAMAVAFGAAACLAAWMLRVTNTAAPALRPATLLEQQLHEVPARELYLFVAYELNRAIEQNEHLAKVAGRRLTRALYASLSAPGFGVAVALTAASTDFRTALLAWFVLGGAVALVRLLARVPDLSGR